MEKLFFFWFLLMQASLFGFGLIAVGLTFLVMFLPDRLRLSRLLALPAIWLLPLVLTALLYEGGVKSADWLQHLFYPSLAVYLATAIWVGVTLPTRRKTAIAVALINAPFCGLGAFIVAMSGSGTWL